MTRKKRFQRFQEFAQRPNVCRTTNPTKHDLRGVSSNLSPKAVEYLHLGGILNDEYSSIVPSRIARYVFVFTNHSVHFSQHRIQIDPIPPFGQPERVIYVHNNARTADTEQSAIERQARGLNETDEIELSCTLDDLFVLSF